MSRIRVIWAILAIVLCAVLVVPLTRVARSLVLTRGGMSTFTRLVGSANAQDVEAVRTLCSTRYLAEHPIRRASEGGVIGLPRNIHKNFQVWAEGDDVFVCPTNREGPVYRLIRQGDGWKFDGLVGLLKRGRVEPQEVDRL